MIRASLLDFIATTSNHRCQGKEITGHCLSVNPSRHNPFRTPCAAITSSQLTIASNKPRRAHNRTADQNASPWDMRDAAKHRQCAPHHQLQISGNTHLLTGKLIPPTPPVAFSLPSPIPNQLAPHSLRRHHRQAFTIPALRRQRSLATSNPDRFTAPFEGFQ